METIRKINDELAIAGQVTPEQLKLVSQAGFRSILNLRSAQENGFLSNEQQAAELLELAYSHLPTPAEVISLEMAVRVLDQLRKLPKPTLVHCDSGIRSAAMVMIYIATNQGSPVSQACQQAEQLGLLRLVPQE